MLEKGFIRQSSSPAAAPLLLVPKPAGGLRICQDYRGLNEVTIKNRYPLPLIRETLDSISGAQFCTKLDVISAFNRIRIAEGHEWMTAFITRFGLYEMLVTPFGLCNAPATFQNYINQILHDALDQYCTAYLDDVLIYSKTREEHTRHVNEVIGRLGNAGLQLDISKSEFYTKKTKYLGLIISTEGLSMDPEKVKSIVSWKEPSNIKELQQFLGFSNYCRRFIEGYSGLIQPLTHLLHKRTTWNWSIDQKEAFEHIKKLFTQAPILRYFDYNKHTVVETDASNWASGGTLLQIGDDDMLHPVAFFSSKHSPAESNYDIYDKELLAIIKALEEWRPELAGVQSTFEIITDHKNLRTFLTAKKLNQRQVGWSEFLSQFNFIISYRPGSKALLPDTLSRLPGLKPIDPLDERLQQRFRALIPSHKAHRDLKQDFLKKSTKLPDNENVDLIATLSNEIALIDVIYEVYEENKTAREMVICLKDSSRRIWSKPLKRILMKDMSEFKLNNGLIYFRNRLFAPDHKELRLLIVQRTHSSGPAGHPGRVKTLDLLQRTYWWPQMTKFVANFVRGCALCCRTKTPHLSPPGFLKPLDIPVRPWADISIDHIVDLPPCERRGKIFYHILVVVDRLTKMRHFIPTTSLDTDELLEFFIKEVYKLHGTPKTIISDRGSAFVSEFWRRLNARLSVDLKHSSAFHPQTDGQTEIVNSALNQYLRAFVNFTQDDWVDWLPFAEFAGNNQVNETIGVSPFFANYGYDPYIGIEPRDPKPPNLSESIKKEYLRADAIVDRFNRILEKLKAISRQSQERYENNANSKRSGAPVYKEGDQVMVNLKNLKTNRPKKNGMINGMVLTK